MSYNSNRLAGLHIYSILLKHTGDMEHRLTHKQIAYYLKSDYGIELERKAISTYLRELEGCEYLNVEVTQKGSYAYGKFDDSELRVLIDSVLSNKSIDKKRANELIQKLCSLSHKRFKSKSPYMLDLTVKSENKSILSSIDIILEAIDKGKRVGFIYNTYEADKELHPISDNPFIVEPYRFFISEGNYYLFGFMENEKSYFKFELDKITNCSIVEKDGKTLNSLNPYSYVQPNELARVKLRVESNAISEVITHFGKNISIIPKDNAHLDVKFEANLDEVCSWALKHGDVAEIIYPKEARQKIRNIISKLNIAYTNEDEAKQVAIPNGITEITRWDYVLFGKEIDYLFIPKSIAKIDIRAFYGVCSIKEIRVDKDNPTYHSCNNCLIETSTNTLILGGENSIIPEYISRIGKSAFNGRTRLKSIKIPEGVSEIGYMAFSETSLTDIEIPKSISRIDSFAFALCPIKAPFSKDNRLQFKGQGIFADIEKLKEIKKLKK